MTAKIIKSAAPFACANYCLNHDSAEIIDWEGLDIDPSEANRLAESSGQERLSLARAMAHAIDTSFEIQSDNNTAVERPVAHVPLNFMKEDAALLSVSLMRKIAREYLEKMGWSNTQYMVVCHHNAKGNPHIHLYFNRVDNDGKVLNAWRDYERSCKACKELTIKYGLHFSKGRSNTQVADLKGKDKMRYEISNAIDKCLVGCKSWDELGHRLYMESIYMNLVQRKDGSIQGVKFGFMWRFGQTYEVSGSKIGRRYSYAHIDKALRTGKSLNEVYASSKAYPENGFQLAERFDRYGHYDVSENHSHSESLSVVAGIADILAAGLSSGSSSHLKDYEGPKKKKKRGLRR